jgi:membrane protease subunit (stomatin/prohibitin family)
MKWFLLIIILLMAGGGYFEYQVLQDQASTNQQQIADLKAKLQKVTSDNSDLTDAIAKFKKSLVDAQAKEDSLTKDLQAAQAAAPQATAQSPATGAAPVLSSSVPNGPFTTKLGTINTLGGAVYANCQLLKVNPDNIVISYADGITQVQFALLPPPLQQRFGFDPKQGALTNDQVQSLEQQRQSALAAGR